MGVNRMTGFYAARNGHINLDEIKIPFHKFREFFVDTYMYFEEKGYFKLAFSGYHSTPRLMSPSPEAFMFTHVGVNNIFPISYEYKQNKVTTFTLIEVLHKYIRKIEAFDFYEEKEAQKEFREMINKYLICLDEGYVLSEKGYIINIPEDGLGKLFTQDLPKNTDDPTTQRVETAIKMFFKYDSNETEKMKAINLLVDVLEPYRKNLKQVTTEKHDKLIFEIVNQYGIRHNRITEKTDYDKPIWYEWMFHYYLATVHATLRLGLNKAK